MNRSRSLLALFTFVSNLSTLSLRASSTWSLLFPILVLARSNTAAMSLGQWNTLGSNYSRLRKHGVSHRLHSCKIWNGSSVVWILDFKLHLNNFIKQNLFSSKNYLILTWLFEDQRHLHIFVVAILIFTACLIECPPWVTQCSPGGRGPSGWRCWSSSSGRGLCPSCRSANISEARPVPIFRNRIIALESDFDSLTFVSSGISPNLPAISSKFLQISRFQVRLSSSYQQINWY